MDVVSNVRINHYQTNLWKEMPGEWSCINCFFFPILSLSAVVNFHEDEFKGVSESCIYLLSWNWAIEIFHADPLLRINQFRPFYKDVFCKFLDAVLYFQWYQNCSSILQNVPFCVWKYLSIRNLALSHIKRSYQKYFENLAVLSTKRPYILKQTSTWKLQVCLSMYMTF